MCGVSGENLENSATFGIFEKVSILLIPYKSRKTAKTKIIYHLAAWPTFYLIIYQGIEAKNRLPQHSDTSGVKKIVKNTKNTKVTAAP